MVELTILLLIDKIMSYLPPSFQNVTLILIRVMIFGKIRLEQMKREILFGNVEVNYSEDLKITLLTNKIVKYLWVNFH